MKKILTLLLFVIFLMTNSIFAQDIDEIFVFVDTNGNIIENGASIIRNTIDVDDSGNELIKSGISVKNLVGSTDYLKVYYEVERLDNGAYQICFPTTCNVIDEEGSFETAIGQLMGEVQDIQSEWFPEDNGECIVTLTIEVFTKQGGFPPTYTHKAWGPTITLRFVKGEVNNVYCVNGIYYYKTSDNAVAVTYKDENYNSYNGNIVIPESVEIEGETYMVTSIAKNAFKDCSLLYYLSIPVTITSIANNAFSNCNVTNVCIYGTGAWQAGQLPITSIETLYFCSGITSIGGLRVNPSSIYSYSTTPPNCDANSFTNYTGVLHVPTTSTASYFMAPYWCNFANFTSDAIEPLTVTLNQVSAELELNNQIQLTATVSPNNATPNNVVWISTNHNVATVEGGIVTPLSVGECDIMAICIDKQAICHVTVIPPQITITLDKHEARVLPNHLVTLTATCSLTSAELVVTSSDNTIALPRIVNGSIQVLGLKEGTATIKVNSVDGAAIPDECVVTVYTETGDVNADGYVDINDVTALIDYVLTGDNSQINSTNADVDNSGSADINDVTSLISYILNGKWPWQQEEHEWVDLGLPSGTLWATCNIGASAPEEYGDYFAWGETAVKEEHNFSNYMWCRGSYDTMTKYCTNIFFGSVDNKTELEPEDDAAHVNWGMSWRMPSQQQQQELIDNCTWTWTTYNGVNGYLVAGPNGNTLFLPATGCWDGSLYNEGLSGVYWSRTLCTGYPSYACSLQFFSENIYSSDDSRSGGFSVRAVRVPSSHH